MEILHQTNKIYDKVLERSKGMCEVCGSPGQEMHHCIFGRGKRKEHESIDSVILLCWNCHHGTYGVHGREGKELDLKPKREL